MTEDNSRLVTSYLSPFLHWIVSRSPNSALAENTRRAAEKMCAAAREEGRREERAKWFASMETARISFAKSGATDYQVGAGDALWSLKHDLQKRGEA